MLLIVVFLATAIAGLAALTSSRVVSETRHQRVLENETRAFNGAYAQLHMALNVVNTSMYAEQNQNVALRDALAGLYGGTVAGALGGTTTGTQTTGNGNNGQASGGTTGSASGTTQVGATNGGEISGYTVDATKDQSLNVSWLDDPGDPVYGFIQGTSVRVYRGRDYINRLQRLKGDVVTEVDPFGTSDRFFVLEAAGRSGDTIRLISALVRETQPFSSFVFFQNRATLGVSGAPRGLIHTNETLAFYFPNGSYLDAVTSVSGFEYIAGATPENTSLRDANPAAATITLEAVDFVDLRTKADLYNGDPGLDAEIKLYRNGRVRVRPHTPPRYEIVEKTRTYQRYIGKEKVTVTERKQVQTGTQSVAYQKQVVDYYKTETYWQTKKVKIGETTETRYRDVQVQVGTQAVVKTRQEPVYEMQTVTKIRKVKVWVPYNSDAGGGTSVGGGATGELGEWVWVDEPYETTESVQVDTKTVEYTVQEPVYKTVQEAYTVTTPIYETQKIQKTRQVPVYKTVTAYRDEPVYEWQDVQVTKTVKKYETVTKTYTTEQFFWPTYFKNQFFTLGEGGGTIYVDGRITKLHGDLKGRLTIVGNEKIRITGNIRYVDQSGRQAMKNGSDYLQPYQRNPDYQGNSVLGVIARDDIVFARTLPSSAELNGTLLSAQGRVGVDGFWADPTGELHLDSRKNRKAYLTPEQYQTERAYDRLGKYRTRKYVKNSLRRIGGIISNNRILETYVTAGKDGLAKVSAGYKRGSSKFDINMMFNPPPNFVDVPRPVVTAFVPVLLVRNNDN